MQMHTFASVNLRQGNRKKESRNWRSETRNDGLALKNRSLKSEMETVEMKLEDRNQRLLTED